jgi:hypothetical protein
VAAGLAGLALAAGLAGCGGLRLEVPPGHRVVVGGVDLARLDELGGLLEIVRDDGVVRLDLPLQREQTTFLTTLPPGRYRLVRLRVTDSPQVSRIPPVSELRGAFEVGDEPAVYVGTLRFTRDRFAGLRLEVTDDYERTIDALRARYRELPRVVARALVRPA